MNANRRRKVEAAMAAGTLKAVVATSTLDLGIEAGALGAILSGSGPTALFLASDEQHSLDIAFALSSASGCADVVQSRGPVSGARITS